MCWHVLFPNYSQTSSLQEEKLSSVALVLSKELNVDLNQIELWNNDTVLDQNQTPSQLGLANRELIGLCWTNAW